MAKQEEQMAQAREHKRNAADCFASRPIGGGRRCRLQEAEEEATAAITASPFIDPSLLELRSLRAAHGPPLLLAR